MNKQILYFYFTFFSVTFYGCNKNGDANLNFIGIYSTSKIVNINAPRMYTKNGFVDNQQTIIDFLNRFRIPAFSIKDSGFVFNKTQDTLNSSLIISFLQKDTVMISGYYPNQTITKIITQKNSNQIVLSSLDSSVYMTVTDPKIDRRYSISYSLEKNNHSLPGFFVIPNSANNIAYACKTLNYSSLVIQNGDLYLPLLTYHISIPNYELWTSNTWTDFNDNISNILQSTDTVIIQTKLVKLIKQ